MAAIARRKVAKNPLNVSRAILNDLKIVRMQLMRNIKCAINVTDLILNINIMNLIHNIESFKFISNAPHHSLLNLCEFAPTGPLECFGDETYNLNEQTQFLKAVADAKKTFDWAESSLAQRYDQDRHVYPRDNLDLQNPYISGHTVTCLRPFKEFPDFRIIYTSTASNLISIMPYNIQIPVQFTSVNGIVFGKNLFYNPGEFEYYKKHYLKYIPLFSDIIVGGSKWANNVHVELDNRRRKQLKKRCDGNQPLSIDEYLKKTISRNIGNQRYYITQMREQHAQTVTKLSGFWDVWKSKQSSAAYEKAYSKDSLEMIHLFMQFSNDMNINELNEGDTHKFLKVTLNDWKGKHENPHVRKSTATFSKHAVRCLKNQYELPKFAANHLELLKHFFMYHVN